MSNLTLQQDQTPASSRPQRNNPLIWGAVLLALGGLMLLQNMGLLDGIGGFIWALVFAGGGLVFGSVYLSGPHERWWALIPAFALFGLAGTIMISEYAPNHMEFLAGAAFLGALGMAFWVIYFTRREFWWAMIPGGVLISLSAVAAVSDSRILGAFDAGSILFFGMGVTFVLVALSGLDEGNSRWWAFIPAGVLLLLGFVVFSQNMAALVTMSYVWPLVLIALGALLLLRAFAGNRNR
ncbi:MAG: hypothetical protein ACRC1H_20250 [Caldilineaceae bacterium]